MALVIEDQSLNLKKFKALIEEDALKNKTPKIFKMMSCTFVADKKEILKFIATIISFCSSLTELILIDDGLDDDDVKWLYLLGAFNRLKYLNLGWNNIGNNGARIVCDALQSSDQLICIDLRSNNIDIHVVSGLEVAAASVKNRKVTLYVHEIIETVPVLPYITDKHSLVLPYKFDEPKMVSDLARPKSDSITFQSQALVLEEFKREVTKSCEGTTPVIFQILDCIFSTAKIDILWFMGYTLFRHESISVLNLCGLGLEDDDLKTIVMGNLTHLDLSRNCLTDEGAETLSNLLKIYPRLLFIDVHDNYIGPNGIEALNAAMANRYTIAEDDDEHSGFLRLESAVNLTTVSITSPSL